MMPGFAISSLIILAGALGVIFLRNLVHCALALALSLLGVAAIYLNLGAEFVAFSQVLVYVGAVAILIVFAVLLTQNKTEREVRGFAPQWGAALAVAALVFGILLLSVRSSRVAGRPAPARPALTSRAIGYELMDHYILPLEAIGLLLTVALIGGIIVALPEVSRPGPADPAAPPRPPE